jgi:hypothetical protein
VATNAASDALQPRARKKLEREIAETVCQKNDPAIHHGKRKHSYYYKDVRDTISAYSLPTLYRLQHIAGVPDMSFGLFDLLSYQPPAEEVINDWCMLYPTITPVMLQNELMHHINALPYYEHLEPQNAGHYPEKRINQGTAIIRVTKHLKQHGVTTSVKKDPTNLKSRIEYIKDRKLRDLLTTSDDPCRLADLIIERKLTTAAQVKEMLATMGDLPTTLTEGAL